MMPIYEFKCAACAQRIEKLCPLGETGAGITCPRCGKPGPNRVMSSFRTARGKGNENGGLELNGGSDGCASCSAASCATCGH
jgi:putative FmdB family regulatory protein